MRGAVLWMSFGRRGDVGAVAVVPDIAFLCKVVEADENEDYCQGNNPRASGCGHFVEVVGLEIIADYTCRERFNIAC